MVRNLPIEDPVLVDVRAKRYHLTGILVHGISRHPVPVGAEVKGHLPAGRGLVFMLVQTLDAMLGILVGKTVHAIGICRSHASAREAILVIEGHPGSIGTGNVHSPGISLEILLGKIVRRETFTECKYRAATIEIPLNHVPQTCLHSFRCHLAVVPEPKRSRPP